MLVLSRKPGEEIVIELPGGNVTITVIDSWDGLVRLGFRAPRSIPIMRSELLKVKNNPSDPPSE